MGLNLMKAAGGGKSAAARLHGNRAERGPSPRKRGWMGGERIKLERPAFVLLHKRRFQSFCHTEKMSRS